MQLTPAQEQLFRLKRVWKGDLSASAQWLPEGVAIEGDFAGIQAYVLRPVPGARGAAKRLRARSFRVADRTQSMAERVAQEFGAKSPFYVAGGRFLVCAPAVPDWETRVAALQAETDRDLLQEFGGEVAFHLSAARYQDSTIPNRALFEYRQRRRARSLEHALIGAQGWQPGKFFAPAGPGWGKCPACLRTMSRFEVLEDQEICEDCFVDVDLGTRLSLWRFDNSPQPAVQKTELLHHFPRTASGPASFEDLAASSAGKQWLGHLRIDADRIGLAFDELNGHPARTWGLSRMLHTFFCRRVQEFLEQPQYRLIYPVYGGGDDLYVIGPWDHVLHLAVTMSQAFQALAGPDHLTFSAGFALGKPHQHILTKSDEAEAALAKAKEAGRNRISALGIITEWPEFHQILRKAGDVLRWYGAKTVPAVMAGGDPFSEDTRSFLTKAFLHDILQLSQSRSTVVARGLWKPLLNHQMHRNVRNPDHYCERWLRQLLEGGDEWRRAPAVVRYVLLAAHQSS